MKNQLIEMFKSSIIVQSTITLIVVLTVCALYLAPIFNPELIVDGESITEVPSELYVIVGTVLGYWFKTKDRFNSDQAAAKMAAQIALILRQLEDVSSLNFS